VQAGTQQSTCKKETRRVWSWSISVEELAMLGLHSQLAETQCMIQLYLQQQSATCQPQQHACFGVLVRSTLHCAALYIESECCTNPVYAAVIRTASKQLQLHDLNSETCQSTSTCFMVSRFGQRTCSLCQLYPSVAQTLCLQQ
jgi:hypothetical protein